VSATGRGGSAVGSVPTGARVTLASMAKLARNDPCPCGSGRKVKRCCGIERGPSEESLARAYLRGAARAAALDLGPISDGDFARLLDELVELRAHELSLQLELPKLFSPALDRLLDAMEHDEVDVGEAPFWELLDRLDTPPERGRLAREVIALCAAGGLDRELAAAALIDLASGSRRLLSASLLDAATASAIASAIAIVCGGCGDREA
jgi:SEC-C motif